MTKVNPPNNELHTYYLPHHAVIKPDSTTTKLRVVFNASSTSSNGTSLNDKLYPGPVLQADLTILLLRWRLLRYMYNADIEKMYRQILVNPAHTPYQRIIIHSSCEETLNDFELNTVTFRINCAPYLAIRTLHQIAQDRPHVSDILKNYIYERWKEEYLKELHKRTKWKYPQRDFEIDDLVVVQQENLPPNQWRIGRILKVYPGPDKRIRVVDVRTRNGVITKLITKLVLLPYLQCLYTYSSFYLILANIMQYFQRRKSSSPKDKRSPSRAKSPKKPNSYDCRICEQDHPLRQCAKFNRMNVRERQKVVQRLKYCTNCLAHSHRLSKCRTNSCCRQCGAKHHTLLHCHERLRPSNEPMMLSVSGGTVTPTVVIKIKANNKWHQIRGLLNPGAEVSSIAPFWVDRLRLPKGRIGNDDWCALLFRSRFDEGSTFSVTAKVNTNLPTLLDRKRLDAKLADRFTNLRLADPEFYLSGNLHLILGADIYPQLIRNGVQPQFFGSAMAQDTMLGWTIIGKLGF